VTGTADSFDPNADGSLQAIAVQADGRIVTGGDFLNIGGQPRNFLARLDATTGAADAFNPNPNERVHALAAQADGRILAAGFFSSIGGQPRNHIARLDGTGAADAFNPNPSSSFPAYVHSMAVQADGKILAGGIFTSIGGAPRSKFARLSNDTAARQDLVITRTAVTWRRGGSSPDLARVTFEYSTDNVNYTLLGHGTASGSDWTLTGLSFSAGQNFYVRARGYYRTGLHNGSESITESVRNAYLAPLQLSTAVSGKTHGDSGTFFIALPLTGEPGVECRASGGDHTFVFTFNNNVLSGTASVTAGTGAVSGSPVFAGNSMTVNLSGVADVQKITVALSGVTDALGQVLPSTAVSANMLIGDINSSKVVNASDIGEVKTKSGRPVTAANFRADVAVSGRINVADIALVKSSSGQSVP
jgi:hypothetical protein